MSEFDSPNYAEYAYERKNEGKYLRNKILMIIGYALFVVGFFLVCYLTRIIPMFALAPFLLWILVFFTWKYVSWDYYYEFKSGMLELGSIKTTKSGRKKKPTLNIHIKEALYIAPYDESSERVSDIKKIYDFSASQTSPHRIAIIFEKDGKTVATIFEGTAKIAKLLSSFCDKAKNLKGKTFHG